MDFLFSSVQLHYAINQRISIHKSGPLPQDEDYLSELASTYRRGLLEVDAFIQDGLNHEERHHDL